MEKKLLYRYVEGNVSDEEARQVVAWLDADEANVREYMALHKLYDLTLMNEMGPEKPLRNKQRRMNLRKWGIELAKVAAVAILVIGVTYWLPTRKSEADLPVSWQTLYVPAGQRAELTLPDCTKVWVNAQSRLIFPDRFRKGKREIKLSGEAFFNVHSDPKHPFVVHTSKMNVVATGTEFNVSSYPASELFSVALLHGKVSLQTADVKELYRMNPNDYVEFLNHRLQVLTIKDPNYFRWREGLICFNNETVSDIIKKLELYYDIAIDVHRQDLLQYRYTGKFRTKDGIEQVLKVLQKENHFSYRKDNEKNRITIK